MPVLKTRPYVIRDVRAIRLLASPIRQAILDVIVARGPSTAAALSVELRKPADRLYYHIKVLAGAGLVVPSGSTMESGRSEVEFDVPGRPMRLKYDPGRPANRRAIARVVTGLLRSTRMDVARALAEPGLRAEGPRREVWAGRVQSMLTSDELAAVNAALVRLIGLIERTRRVAQHAEAKSYQFTWALSPAPGHGSARVSRTSPKAPSAKQNARSI